MIEINLVPEILRKKKRAASSAVVAGPSSGLPKEAIFGIIGGFVAILVVLSLAIQVFITTRIAARNSLKKQLEEVAAPKKNIDRIMNEMKVLKTRSKTLEDVVGKKQVTIAAKLNEISDHLPRGVWLTKVAMEGKYFIIEGSAVSKTGSEIADIHALAGSLKESKLFMSGLKNLELDMIKARTGETLPIADFTMKAEIAK